MSENESAGEKTEQPTEKRLRDAREQGNLPRSRELGTAAVFGAGVLEVMAMSGSIGRGATAMITDRLTDRIPRPDICLGQHVMPGRAGEVMSKPGPQFAEPVHARHVAREFPQGPHEEVRGCQIHAQLRPRTHEASASGHESPGHDGAHHTPRRSSTR